MIYSKVQKRDGILVPAKHDTPLPQPQFAILLLVRFSEPVAFTFLFPFIYQMVKDLNVTNNETQIAYYVGWIASSFAIAQVCTTLLWGMLSDRWGRKPCVLLGLFGTGTSMLLFGFSNSFSWAVVTRCMTGALNGNVAIIRSMATELTDSSNRAKGFSLFPMMFGIGSIFGPVIGGFLYNPTQNLPYLFGGCKVFETYPSLLPCSVISSLCYLCLIFGWLFLEETLPSKKLKLSKYKVDQENNDTIPLINPRVNAYIFNRSMKSQLPLRVEQQLYSETDEESFETSVKKDSTSQWSFSNQTKICILSYSLLSLLNVMMDELFSVWGPAPIEKGGLNLDTNDLALIQSIAGIMIIFTTRVFYPKISKRYSVLKVYQNVFTPLFFILLVFPFTNALMIMYGLKLTWQLVMTLHVLRCSLGVFCFTSLNILMSESADSHVLATVNALAQTFGSLARALGPAVIGAVFSWSIAIPHNFPFDYHFSWILVLLVCLLCSFSARMLIN